ncbi:MAG: hypothetical protein ABIW31_04210 [Novosphingobium sp.]
MSELDELLAILRAEPAHAGLAALDNGVMAGLVQRRETVTTRRGMVLAGLVAVVVGSVAAVAPASPASAESLLGVPASAPSQLLTD